MVILKNGKLNWVLLYRPNSLIDIGDKSEFKTFDGIEHKISFRRRCLPFLFFFDFLKNFAHINLNEFDHYF